MSLLAVRVDNVLAVEGDLVDAIVTTLLNSEDFILHVGREKLEVLVVCILHKNGIACRFDRRSLRERWYMAKLLRFLLLLRVLSILVAKRASVTKFVDTDITVDTC